MERRERMKKIIKYVIRVIFVLSIVGSIWMLKLCQTDRMLTRTEEIIGGISLTISLSVSMIWYVEHMLFE